MHVRFAGFYYSPRRLDFIPFFCSNRISPWSGSIAGSVLMSINLLVVLSATGGVTSHFTNWLVPYISVNKTAAQ